MNTSAKGASYENRFKAELYRRGAWFVTRAAASKGPFDLVSVGPDVTCGYQLKAGRMSCAAADRLCAKLLEETQLWAAGHFLPSVVHRRKGEEFCEH